jgi:hypothetical protein
MALQAYHGMIKETLKNLKLVAVEKNVHPTSRLMELKQQNHLSSKTIYHCDIKHKTIYHCHMKHLVFVVAMGQLIPLPTHFQTLTSTLHPVSDHPNGV